MNIFKKVLKPKLKIAKELYVLLAIFLALYGISATARASANPSCLNKEEIKQLNDVRSRLIVAKWRKPDCTRLRGAGACISPAEQAILQYLERKENGEEEACKSSSGIDKASHEGEEK